MAAGGGLGWKAREAAAAAFLASLFLLAGASCGRNETPSVGQRSEPSGNAVPASTQRAEPSTAPGAFEVVVVPVTPSRSVPPGITVKSLPGRGAEILSVRWFLNGAEQETAIRMDPSRFRRGDRIHAVVTLRSDGNEVVQTTKEVVAGNALPAVSDVRIDPRAPHAGGTVTAVVQGQDLDGDPLNYKYQWYADNVVVPGGQATLSLKDVKRGAWIHVAVTPNDGVDNGAWMESPRYEVVNALPVVKSGLPKEVPPSRHFVYRIVAEDPDGDPLTYTLAKGPPGMTLKGDTIEWEVPDEYIGKPVETVVQISDDHGGRTDQNISMTIQPPK
jgi:hypothetical protein